MHSVFSERHRECSAAYSEFTETMSEASAVASCFSERHPERSAPYSEFSETMSESSGVASGFPKGKK